MSTEIYARLYKEIFVNKNNILMHGSGGTGKTYTILKLYKDAIKNGKLIYLTSTTGLSALAINGMTIHKFSGIKTGENPIQIIVRDIHAGG